MINLILGFLAGTLSGIIGTVYVCNNIAGHADYEDAVDELFPDDEDELP